MEDNWTQILDLQALDGMKVRVIISVQDPKYRMAQETVQDFVAFANRYIQDMDAQERDFIEQLTVKGKLAAFKQYLSERGLVLEREGVAI